VLAFLVLGFVLSACQWPHHAVAPRTVPCTPPAGGRCAASVAWPGAIVVADGGRWLHGPILCGGTLRATETDTSVTITLHVGALGPGAMSCARVDVGVRLRAPLGTRNVVDGVSGRAVRVDDDRPTLAAPAP
jgi:hypothetical protein